MPLTNENRFKCDLPSCGKEFTYDPGRPGQPPPQWDAATSAALDRLIQVVHGKTGTVTWYCGDIHLIEAVGKGLHLPQPGPKIVAASTDAEVKAAAAGAKAVTEMKQPRPS